MYCCYCNHYFTKKELTPMKQEPSKTFYCPECEMPVSWETSAKIMPEK